MTVSANRESRETSTAHLLTSPHAASVSSKDRFMSWMAFLRWRLITPWNWNVWRVAHLADAVHQGLGALGCARRRRRRWVELIEILSTREDGLGRRDRASLVGLAILLATAVLGSPTVRAVARSCRRVVEFAVCPSRVPSTGREVLERLWLMDSPSLRYSVMLLLRGFVRDEEIGRPGLNLLGVGQGPLVGLLTSAPGHHGRLGAVTVAGGGAGIERPVVVEHWDGK